MHNNQRITMPFFEYVLSLVDLEEFPRTGADAVGVQTQSQASDFQERVDGQPVPPTQTTQTVAVSSNALQIANPEAKDVLAVHTGSAGLTQPGMLDRAANAIVHGARNVQRVNAATGSMLQAGAKSHGLAASAIIGGATAATMAPALAVPIAGASAVAAIGGYAFSGMSQAERFETYKVALMGANVAYQFSALGLQAVNSMACLLYTSPSPRDLG